ncbi:MAG TPA: YtxH domain-containing protein [Candidatus Sulfomarinibacteraceae bacterium]|nr:YtxH domain-containing protein [Candidatus Sulfomarinibacteraceae bacterium]
MNKANKQENITLAGFLGGLLIGGMVGAGAMVLLAPQSGKKTRQQMRRKVREVREETTGTIRGGMAQARTKAHDMSTSILEQTEALQQRGQDTLDDGKERLATAVDAGKSVAKGS